MCGIIGLYHPTENVSGEIYDALIQVQHRGQDAAGIATWDTKKLSLHKELGVQMFQRLSRFTLRTL